MYFSATISATDPVAVVMLLSKLSVPHRLRLLLEGESLLNDGVALILYKYVGCIFNLLKQTLALLSTSEFYVFSIMNKLVHDSMHVHVQDQPGTLKMIVWVIVGVLAGIVLARLCGYLFNRVSVGPLQRALIFLGVYATYFACESWHGSGILGVVAFAVVLSDEKYRLTALSNRFNKVIWQFLAFWANCVLFVLTGLLASQNYRK